MKNLRFFYSNLLTHSMVRNQVWNWFTILASITICFMVIWLNVRQTELLQKVADTLTNLHVARIELAKGFLYVTLSTDPASPFSREEGLALLNQAAISLEEVSTNLDLVLSTKDVDSFRQDLNTFQIQLEIFRTAGSSTPAAETELRIAFHKLESQANAVDEQANQKLEALQKRFNLQFALVLGGAAILLATISAASIYAEQARQQADKALRESEARYRLITDNISDVIWVMDPATGKFTYVSPSVERLRGYTAEEVIAQPVSASLTPESLKVVSKGLEKILPAFIARGSGTETRITEVEQICKDNSTVKTEVTTTYLFNDQGQVEVIGVSRNITERKQAEEEMRQSEEFLRLAYEAADLGIWKKDLRSGAVHFDERAQLHYGFTTPDTTLTEFLNRVHPDDFERLKAEIATAISPSSSGKFSTEYRMIHPNGSIHWLAVSIRVEFEEGEGVERSAVMGYGTVMEITERKQAEELLRESEEKYRTLVGAMADGVFVAQDGRFIYANSALPERLGYTVAEFIGLPFSQVIAPDHLTIWTERYYQRIDGQNPVSNYQTQLINKDHTEKIWFELRANSIVYGGKPAVLGIVRDVTERKLADEILRESEERLDLVMEGSQLGYWDWDIETGTVHRNERWAEMLGYTLDEVKFSVKQWTDLHHPDDREAALESIQNHLDGKTPAHRIEYRMRTKDGSYKWILDQARIVKRDLDGKPLRMSGTHTDINERKQAEETLKQRLEDLSLINELNTIINQGADIAQITEWISSETKAIFGGLGAGIFLIDVNTQTIAMLQLELYREPIIKLEKLINRPFPQIAIPLGGNDHFNQVLQSDRGLLFNDKQGIHRWLSDFTNTTFLSNPTRTLIQKLIPIASKLVDIKSVIAIPLKAGDEVLGLIEFTSAGAFDETTLERLMNIRHQLAEAILRKRTEQSLRESEEKYRLLSEELEKRIQQRTVEVQDLYNNAPAGYHSLDKNGCYVQVNQTQLNWSGYTLKEMIGHPFGKFVIAEDQANFDREFQLLKERGFIRDVEFEMVRKDGSTYPILINATAIYDIEGNFVTSRSTVFDNTERKKAEVALRESQENLQNFLDNASDLIQSLNAEGRFIYVNNAWCDALGYTHEEANLLTMFDVIDSTFYEHCNTVLRELASNGIPQQMEVAFITKSGELLIVEGSVSGQVDRDNHSITNGIFRNVTKRKQAEEALRTGRDKLSAANAALEKAARMKDEFLASMSRELRTPLTGILGLSEALQYNTYGTLTEKQDKAVQFIQESGRHLLDLINDILDLSKIEAGMLDLDIAPVSLADVCKSSLQLTKGMAQKKHQTIQFSMEPVTIHVRGDGRRLKQMLVNLLSNAIKFSPENGTLGLEVVANEKEKVVRLTVWDNGIGIATENIDKLFQPFVQLESSLSRQYEGTGLGLSLVHRMADLHGGSVEIKSTLGKGSRFTIVLPWDPDTLRPHISKNKGNVVFNKVLIFENPELNTEKLKNYLSILGMEAISYSLGQDSIEKTIQEKPDMILLDIPIAGQSGFDLLTDLKANSKTLNIPVICCSIQENRSQAISLGAAAYLVKPISLPELRQQIEKVETDQKLHTHVESKSASVKPTVMIVDDNEVVIETLSDFLSSHNFQVHSAHSGMELFEIVEELHPDIILMDIQMPVIDGIEATRRIRSHLNPHIAKLPIIAITALAMTGDRERCLAAGANEYLSKAVELRLLVETIHQVLGEQ